MRARNTTPRITSYNVCYTKLLRLYYTTDDELFPGGQLLASERFTDDSFWQPVPEHHILILDSYNFV